MGSLTNALVSIDVLGSADERANFDLLLFRLGRPFRVFELIGLGCLQGKPMTVTRDNTTTPPCTNPSFMKVPCTKRA